MSRRVSQINRYLTLAQVVAEAHAMGARFYVAGDQITRSGELPATLAATLDAHRDLWSSFFNISEDDHRACAFFATLNVALIKVTSPDACRAAVDELDRNVAQYGGPIAADIETAAKTPRAPRLIKLNKNGSLAANQRPPKKPLEGDDDGNGTDESRAALSPYTGRIASLQLYAGGKVVWVFRDEALTTMLRSRWLRSRAFVAHNAKFEMLWIALAAQELHARPLLVSDTPATWQCTLQGAGLLIGVGFGGETRGLDVATKELLGLDMPKELQTSDLGLAQWTKGQWCYAAADPVVTFRLWQVIKPELIRLGRVEAYKNQVGCSEATAWMEYRGVLANRGKFEKQLGVWTRRISDARNAYREKTGKVAPDGSTETRAWLAEVLSAVPELKARWPRTEKSNELSTSEHAIDRLYDVLPEARDVIEIRRADKLLRSFGHKFIAKLNKVTGRFHSEFSIAGAKTGRFSAKTPNLQQVPGQRAGGDFREAIEAATVRLLVCADYSQIEFRTLGEIADDDAIRAIYLPGGSSDIHTEIAAAVNSLAFGAVTKEQRSNAKAIAFGAVYGMGSASLVSYAHTIYGVEWTEDEARERLNDFFDRFRGAWRWRRINYRECEARGYILIPSGRIIHRDWELEKNIKFTLACNAPVQGAVGDLIMIAMRLIHRRLLRAGFPIDEGLILSVHDELILEVRADRAEEALQILQQAMIDAWVRMFPGAPTKGLVNTAICRNWAEFK
jgi:DNA polymerase-1